MPEKPTVQPLPLDAAPAPAPTNATSPTPPVASSELSPSERWVQEHPEGAEFRESAPPTAIPANLPPPDPSTDVTRAEATPAAAPPVDGAPQGEVPPATAPAAAAPPTPGEKPAPTTPAPKPALALDEAMALVDGGPTWTRGQVIEGLKERHTLSAETKAWESLFRMPVDKAKETWEPIIEAIVARPEAQGFLDDYLFSNPDKAKYLEDCAAYYDTQAPTPAATTPARAPSTATIADPALRARVEHLESFAQRQEKAAVTERLNREVAYVRETYPFFNEDQGAWDALCAVAKSLNAQDVAGGKTSLEARGLLDALAMNRATYDARMVHIRDQAAAHAAATNTAPPPEPARALSPNGAAPQATRPTDSYRPRSFKGDLDAGVDDWINNPPPEFR